MDLGHGRGVMRILFARYLTSDSGIPGGRLISVRSFAVSAGEMRYPVKYIVRFNCRRLCCCRPEELFVNVWLAREALWELIIR